MAQNEVTSHAMAKVFRDQANIYELRAGGATTALSHFIMEHLPSLPCNPVILDNACGTCAVTADILKLYPSAKINAVDASQPMVDIVKERIRATPQWQDHVEAKVCDGQHLDLPSNHYDLSVTNCGIFFFADPAAGAREIARTLKPDATACVTCWKESRLRDIFEAVQAVVQPAVSGEPSAMFEKWGRQETIESTLTEAGLRNVTIQMKEVAMAWEDDETLVKAMTLNLGALAGEKWTEEEKRKIPTALERVLKERPELFEISREFGRNGVRQIAYVAFAQK